MRRRPVQARWLVPLVLFVALLLPALAQAGEVKGTVEPAEWAQEVEVCVVERQPSELCAVPGADGSYVIEEVPFGAVRIEFIPSIRSRLLTQYYDYKSKLSEATLFFITQEKPVAFGIDADLVEGGRIEGAATAAGLGTPLAEVEVCAVSVSVPTVRRCGETDAGGNYELHSLPSGTYSVAFRGKGDSAEYQPQYYEQAPALAQAKLITVTAGKATTGIDASLSKGARIEGSVSDAEGDPLPAIAVCLFDAAASTAERCTYSAEAGSYAFEGLPSGSYQVGFSLEPGEAGLAGGVESDAFASQYFEGVVTRSEAATISPLAPAVVTGVDARLDLLPSPPAPLPSAAAVNPIVAAAPISAAPKPKARRCRKGFRKMKVGGKVRCVRKHGKKGHRRRPAENRRREVVQQGGVRVHFNGGISPSELPRSGSRPVRVSVETKIAAAGSATPPRLQRIKLEINSHGHIDPRGLPRCTLQEIQPSTTQKAMEACGSSLVGRGVFAASVALGRQAPFPASGPLYAFNGTFHGQPAILAHVYGTDPVPTSFTLPFLIKPARGTFGTALVASLPQAGGDNAYVTRLALNLGRNFRSRGKPRSYLTASCPAPAGFNFATFPFAKAVLSFHRGPTIASTIDRTCRVRG
jgi:carboxypeptidase family protein